MRFATRTWAVGAWPVAAARAATARAESSPADVPLADGDDIVGGGGSAILAPDGSYLAEPLWNEEGILYADLDPQQLYEARQRFDPAGHYHRPDLLRLEIG